MSKLIFIGDLEPYRQQILTVRRRQYERLLEQADSYRTMELPVEHPKKSTTYMGIAILNLALAYRLSGEEKYLQEARRFINTVLGYEKWGNAHLVNVDLSASWILFGLSLGYDWLSPALTPEERERILAKIRHHARIIYEYRRSTYGSGWSTNFYQNHNWINMTGLAAAGYLLGKTAYTREAKEDMDRVYSLMAEDGSNYEGVVYWRYGGMWLFVYAHLLKIQEGVDHFRTNSYLRNTFYYRLYQSCGDFSQQLNYGDCHDRHSGHPACVYYKAAAEYRDGYAQKLGNMVIREFLREEDELSQVKPGILPEAVFEFLWYDPTVEERDFDDLPLTRYFPDLGLLSIRSSWQRNARVMTIKCGAPGGAKQWREGWKIRREENIDLFSLSHHHPDNLAYIFANGSEYFSCEDGYNRNIMPDNHNVLLVDGQYSDAVDENDVYMASVEKRIAAGQDNFDPETYGGFVRGLCMDDGLVLYRGETSGVYPEALEMREVSRLLLTDGLKFWVFADVFTSGGEHRYGVVCNTDPEGRVEKDGIVYPMATGDIRCRVFSQWPVRQRQYPQEIVSIMTTQEKDKVCRTSMNTLVTETEQPCSSQVFFEAFTFEDSDAAVQVQEQSLILCCGGTRYCVTVDPYDPMAGRSPIRVTVEGPASQRKEYCL